MLAFDGLREARYRAHGPLTPNAGMRTTTSRKLAARAASRTESELLDDAFWLKFSIITSHVASNRNASRRPSGVERSTAMPRLFVFAPQNNGDHSHHSASVSRRRVFMRIPSGRRGPSMWITPAPSPASTCAASGPPQKAVKSATRTPASGSSDTSADAVGAGLASAHSVPASVAPIEAPVRCG